MVRECCRPRPRRREVAEAAAEEFCSCCCCLEDERKGDGDGGVDGVDGVVVGRRPRSFLALMTREWRRVSGPNASRIISLSPWS